MTPRALTAANQITILRLVFVPIFAINVVEGNYEAALLVLAAAALSDILDGIVARISHQISPLGVALDPIADKILMTTAFVTLSYRGILPWWLTILVLSRDVAIVMIALLISLVAGYRPFHPSKLGKASTVVQVTTVLAALGHVVAVPWVRRPIVEVLIYLAAALAVASALHYLLIVQHRYARPDLEAEENDAVTVHEKRP
jgi:cardiolipin synthase (CMP-forming)